LAADVRWIAATNRDLQAMIRAGSFREDLYHRLAVFPIRLPPLRERREDVAPLAEALLRRVAAEMGRPPLTLDPMARKEIEAADLRGNIRELRNLLERAVILADGDVVRPEHLWLDPSGLAPESASSADGGASVSAGAGPGGAHTLEDLERTAITAALTAAGGNRRKAAEQLGIGLRTLYEKLKRYGQG
jgi:two-component system response regulator FlrC